MTHSPEPSQDDRQISAPKLGPLPGLPPLQINFGDGAPLACWLQILASNLDTGCDLDRTSQPSAHGVVAQHDDKRVVVFGHVHHGYPAQSPAIASPPGQLGDLEGEEQPYFRPERVPCAFCCK
jgi:hypothetical protein